jgi:hypothetical protein
LFKGRLPATKGRVEPSRISSSQKAGCISNEDQTAPNPVTWVRRGFFESGFGGQLKSC